MKPLTIAFYDAQRSRYAFFWDSYWGGDRYRSPSSTTIGTARLTRWAQVRDAEGNLTDEWEERDVATYRTYLVPHPGEARREFEVRLALAAYVNIPKTIVEAYVEAVVGPSTRDLGELAPYLSNLNGRGRGWAAHVEDVARWVQVYGWTATLLEPPTVNPATNAAEEAALGVSLRACHVHPTAVAWIAVDRDGNVQEFAFVDAPYVPQDSAAAQIAVTVYVYTPTEWRSYVVEMRPGEVLSVARERIASGLVETDKGPVALGRVPVVFAFATEDTSTPHPLGQSTIDDTCDHARQVYNELSWIEEIHRKTAFPFLGIPEPDAGGELAPQTRAMVGPTRALGYPSSAGAPAWIQPSAESTAELRAHVLFVVMLAIRMAGLEVSLDAAAGADASGVAIELRNRKFNATCVKLAKNLATYESQCFELARATLGRPNAATSTTYPKRFVLPDPNGDLKRLVDFVSAFGQDLSPDTRRVVVAQALEAAARLSDEELARLVESMRVPAPAAPPQTPPNPANPA